MREFKDADLVSLNKWLAYRGKAPVHRSDLPVLGFVVPGVAISFVRQCEGNIGIMEGLTTNPLCSSETRHRALNHIYDIIKKTDNKTILGWTENEQTLDRAKAQGFREFASAVVLYTKE